ncbi:hypothetical protein BKA62DRAFT_710637 [Auriculariales sp. MPI-PUGE-AT-0066]|nr:hypothetical protein BKA62DRAFT_710637 [Auriculariales sp. MPI-PUGE-AT-0066]
MPEALTPPTYCESLPSPAYTTSAGAEEISLDQTVRVSSRHDRGTHSVVREYQSKGFEFSVTFQRQRDDVGTTPTYRQEDIISGFVQLKQRGASTVHAISIKIEGHLELTTSNIYDSAGGSKSSFLNATFELWKQSGRETIPPDILDYALPLPPTFIDNHDVERPLPSSISLPASSGVTANICYSVDVKVQIKGFLKKSHRLNTPIKFGWRSNPPVPPLALEHSCLSTLKSAPESWGQLSLDIPLLKSTEGLRCTLALPASRVYCIKDPIPVHVQIAGPSSALRQFLPHSLASVAISGSIVTSTSSGTTTGFPDDPPPFDDNLSPVGVLSGAKCQIHLILQRRVMISIFDNLEYRSLPLSGPAQLVLVHSDIDAGWIAWNGVLVPDVGEAWAPEPLRIHGLSISDTIVLSVRSTDKREAAGVVSKSQSFPVKFVVDPFPL